MLHSRFAEFFRQLVIQRSCLYLLLLNSQGVASCTVLCGRCPASRFCTPTVCAKVQKTFSSLWHLVPLKRLKDLVYFSQNGMHQSCLWTWTTRVFFLGPHSSLQHHPSPWGEGAYRELSRAPIHFLTIVQLLGPQNLLSTQTAQNCCSGRCRLLPPPPPQDCGQE